MFGPVGTTPYDLRFRLFGIPVTVIPWFWLAALITGWQPSSRDYPDLLAIWIGCLFVSILVHEMGHALTALAFGWPPQIYLYGFGGLAVYRPTSGRATGRSVLISFAGPAAGFVLYGLIFGLQQLIIPTAWFENLRPRTQLQIADFIGQMQWINLRWGLVNLLPVLPLDGGRIAEALLTRFRPWDGPRLAAMLSVVVAGLVAIYFVTHRERYGTYPALLFGLLAFSNIQSLQEPRGPW
ncbi:MAG TPA: site-2 protease family protein [Planctomycetaceae bacterium]|jgi:stage IV sporulation protein FB|nr:site-2 protease family protein [Planctomycetaceae bacterium]